MGDYRSSRCDENAGDPHALDRQVAEEVAAALEGLGERLKADLRASGVPWYVEADVQGRVVFRDVDTDEELAPEVVDRWRRTHGRPRAGGDSAETD